MSNVGHPLRGLHVLLAEDEYLVAAELTRMLRGLGALVLGPVGTVEQASKLEEQSYDMALLNVDLHGEPTFPFAETLLQRGVPVGFVTGYDGAMLPGRFRPLPRVEKPVEVASLTTTMLRLAGSARSVA